MHPNPQERDTLNECCIQLATDDARGSHPCWCSFHQDYTCAAVGVAFSNYDSKLLALQKWSPERRFELAHKWPQTGSQRDVFLGARGWASLPFESQDPSPLREKRRLRPFLRVGEGPSLGGKRWLLPCHTGKGLGNTSGRGSSTASSRLACRPEMAPRVGPRATFVGSGVA